MSNLTLTIICPVYNEEEGIRQFYQALINTLEKLDKIEWEILFVLDPGQDNTEGEIVNIIDDDERVRLIVLSRRFGHQMSLVAGMDNTDSDIIIMMDADLQHPPELIIEMIDTFLQGYEVVYTIRDFPGDTNVFKRFGSKIFYSLMNSLSEIELSQGEADYRLISNRVANVFKNSIRERNQFLRGLFNWVGYKRIGINYQPLKRAHGKSKYSFSTMIHFASSGITSFSKKPLQFAISFGILFAFFGFLFSIYAFIQYFLNNQIPSGWTTLGILISFFSGIQLLFLGILGEYVGAVFDEVKARPLYLIDKKINLD